MSVADQGDWESWTVDSGGGATPGVAPVTAEAAVVFLYEMMDLLNCFFVILMGDLISSGIL